MSLIIALTVFVLSLIGMALILFRKIHLLLELPEAVPVQFHWKEFLTRIKNSSPFLKDFSFEMFLQKILSRVRVLTLKTDSKTSNWLQRLRARSQKKKFEEDDSYWQEIKKSTKE
ncbi:MAG: hypothetical protein PHE52_02795 [Candidatus Pacebacteria bacterium]|nr:hypothetical protein [Candidatus Paceibacterota bacterium]